MRIKRIVLNNFRIYKGENQIDFRTDPSKNITIIAGKNGFGKTTFLTALVWAFYGRLMAQVEERYRLDIKGIGGYENYLKSLLNKDIAANPDQNKPDFFVEIELTDINIPSIPCRSVTIKRSFNLENKQEELLLLIDGNENELTKDVGYELFINDFILPREIAKFFFFDAEKIVSLAEAKSRAELQNLSRAYSEVLGIKKYEELKNNLESFQSKLKRRGISGLDEAHLNKLLTKEKRLVDLLDINQADQDELSIQLTNARAKSDALQEQLIREGNSVTLEELKELKASRDSLKKEGELIKTKFKKLIEVAPLVIAGKKLFELYKRSKKEYNLTKNAVPPEILKKEIKSFTQDLILKLENLITDENYKREIKNIVDDQISKKFTNSIDESKEQLSILLDYSESTHREFKAFYNYIQGSYKNELDLIVQEEKNNRILLNRALKKIKQGEARKDNPLAFKYRTEKQNTDIKIGELQEQKEILIQEFGKLSAQLTSHQKVLSEYEKNFKLVENDKKKFEVSENLLGKVNQVITRIKEEKKYSLQKSLLLSLKSLMHKQDFIVDVRITITNDIMDIDLLDKDHKVINKDSLSKGEQQLYATALLKALVAESSINFPVFIDSPLQKFDKFHSENIIKEFYPSVSEQVILFPLLEKELSKAEYDLLLAHLNQTIVIQNMTEGSQFREFDVLKLYDEIKEDSYVA